MNIIFVSFADKKYVRSLRRIEEQARQMNIYSKVIALNENGLDAEKSKWIQEFSKKYKRGYGYWIWKPLAIQIAMRAAKEGDIIHYVDAGCHLNPSGRERLRGYINKLHKSSHNILAFSTIEPGKDLNCTGYKYLRWLEQEWTKEDIFKYFNVEKENTIRFTDQVQATTIFLKKNQFTESFVNEWFRIMSTNVELLDDSPSKNENVSVFIENRHDQSIFSIMCKQCGYENVSSFEIYHPNRTGDGQDWDILAKFPIHARRDKELSLADQIIDIFRKLIRKVAAK